MHLSIVLFERHNNTQYNGHTAIYRTHVLKATAKHTFLSHRKKREKNWKKETKQRGKELAWKSFVFVFVSFRFVYITVPHAMRFFSSLSSEHFECVRHTTMLQITTFRPMCSNVYRLFMYYVYLDEQVHLFHTQLIVSILAQRKKHISLLEWLMCLDPSKSKLIGLFT